MGDVYTHGHHESVLRSHVWRTAENSAGYLLAHLGPELDLLDVGCGPGTITLDLAGRVAPGRVLGIDTSGDVIEQATAAAAAAGSPVEFTVGSAYQLDLADDSFDVVHAHQVLQHLADPVAAITELRRVLRPGGLLAVRDSDYAGFFWSPTDDRLDRWLALYHELTAHNDAEADAGRFLPAWVRAAGFEELTVSSSTWTFTDVSDRAWWGGLWADRVERSSFATQAVEYGLSSVDELADLAAGWRAWATKPDALFVVPHVEVLARA